MQLLTIFSLFIGFLALIALGAWLVRRYTGTRLGSTANRGRLPRLAAVDVADVDTRRRLVLVRRDNIEHLLMIGGPTDIVIETNIVRAAPQRDPAAQRGGPVGTDLPPRVAPLPDTSQWTDASLDLPDYQEHVPPEPSRPTRPSFTEDVRRAPPSPERRGIDPLSALAPEPVSRPDPRNESRNAPARPRQMPRSEPMPPRGEPSMRNESSLRSEALAPRAEPMMPRSEPLAPRGPAQQIEPAAKAPSRSAPPAPPASSADQNLADMAQRLEAALRRPPAGPADRAPPVVPESPSRTTSSRAASDVSVYPPTASEAPPVAPPGPRGAFENLEDEMANLLGRPKTPT
jgi:flagellar protein FliO/FliZ